MGEKREKFYTVSARLVFSSIMVVLIMALILGASIVINRGPVLPLLGVIGASTTTVIPYQTQTPQTQAPPIVVAVVCTIGNGFRCANPYFNISTGVLTVAISQSTGFN